MASEKVSSSNPMEQFIILAKSAKGMAAVELIKQALESPNLYVFGELMDTPNIQELAGGPHAGYLDLTKLFAYGTYSDYKDNKDKLPEMSPVMLKKLKHLTIVALATKTKCIPYKVLLEELDMKNLRELEDMIIEVIYADIIRGKLDQKNQQLEVDYAIGRDIQPEHITEISRVLQDWCDGCDAVLGSIEQQVVKANQNKELQAKIKQQTDQEVTNIKKTLKTTQQQQDMEEQMVTDTREASSQGEKPSKKPSKTKGLRGSAKFWGKSS